MSESDAVEPLMVTETKNTKVDNQEIHKDNKEKETPKEHVKQGRIGPMCRTAQQIRRDRENQKLVKAQIMKDMQRHLQRPHVRKAYEYFRRKINPKNDLNSEKTREIVKVSADENFLAVTVYRRSPSPVYE